MRCVDWSSFEALLPSIRRLRQTLHAHPERSGFERETVRIVEEFLQARGLTPERTGGGLLVRIAGDRPGPTRLFRADLDAVASSAGLAHACGHDGHASMLAGALVLLFEHRTGLEGTVLGLFQPAEENGQGMKSLLEALLPLSIDRAFALHNLPGHPLGTVFLRPGPITAASTGLRIALEGRSSHASEPHLGRNPIPILADLVGFAMGCPSLLPFGHPAHVVPVQLSAGEEAFGTNPGDGVLGLTLRADETEDLEAMIQSIEAQVAARSAGFRSELLRVDAFPATVNAPEAVQEALRAAERLLLPVETLARPFPWSEDFGHLTRRVPGALIGLGAGEDCPVLHSPEYDFPDALLEPGIRLWLSLA